VRISLPASLALLLALAPAPPAAAAGAPDAEVMAPIQEFLEAFNKGDAAAAAATHDANADLVIIDEVPPYLWHGKEAFQSWSRDLASHDQAKGISGQAVKLGAATRVEIEGAGAYVVTPAVYTFMEKGVAMRETAEMTFVLRKGEGGWRIQAWTWNGDKPAPAPASAAK
jgi:ketosteroid isomerase-like protein